MCLFTHHSQRADRQEKLHPYGSHMPDSDSHVHTPGLLSQTDLSILRVLSDSKGRVVSRDSLLRLAGIDNVSARRADASLVVLRKVLGTENVITVRRRGWMLSDEAHKAAVKLLAREIELSP
jgi:DNA-binding winged helix-turn-helix (wHTH) protein